MMTAEPMVARRAHYTALLDMIDHRGATKLLAPGGIPLTTRVVAASRSQESGSSG
jgi:hypothetical protein